jgi:hypothetical protein
MTLQDIVQIRLSNHLLSHPKCETPGAVVRWMGAVQAQDFAGALWAIGLRLPGSTERDVEQALAGQAIVRTWPMRGTLHFVAPEDVRWMLELLTPRVIARSAGRYRQLGLDDATFSRCRDVLEKTLRGSRRLSRKAIYQVLEAAGISTGGQRGLHILGWLAQKGVICFGPRDGKQPTFALLEEWVPAARRLDREAALAELARRYFTSHGPATLRDFVWWSGLTVGDAKVGLRSVESELERAEIGRQEVWFSPPRRGPRARPVGVHLLPVYDEYAVAYRDRDAILDRAHAGPAKNGISGPVVLAGGRIVGTWRRTLKKHTVGVTPSLFAPLGEGGERALAAATKRYAAFLGLSAAP